MVTLRELIIIIVVALLIVIVSELTCEQETLIDKVNELIEAVRSH